jgi:hypothetical protein
LSPYCLKSESKQRELEPPFYKAFNFAFKFLSSKF